jgi:hypothetical protein
VFRPYLSSPQRDYPSYMRKRFLTVLPTTLHKKKRFVKRRRTRGYASYFRKLSNSSTTEASSAAASRVVKRRALPHPNGSASRLERDVREERANQPGLAGQVRELASQPPAMQRRSSPPSSFASMQKIDGHPERGQDFTAESLIKRNRFLVFTVSLRPKKMVVFPDNHP